MMSDYQMHAVFTEHCNIYIASDPINPPLVMHLCTWVSCQLTIDKPSILSGFHSDVNQKHTA